MSASEENLQVEATSELGSSSDSCGKTSSGSTNDDCAVAVTPIDSSTVSETPDETASCVTEKNQGHFKDQKEVETVDDTMIKESQSVSAKESEGNERQQDHEQAQTTPKEDVSEEGREEITAVDGEETTADKTDYQKAISSINEKEENIKDDKEQTIIVNDRNRTTEEELESQKPEKGGKDAHGNSLNQPDSNNTANQSEDDGIEWLTPFSMPRKKQNVQDKSNSTDAENDKEGEGKDGALKMLKKGAVAAVGGTMVGVGLVMIPLPTPFGAVVASSGLAVLGSEFNEAKELNDKLIDGAKGHFNKARDTIVKGIENMHSSDDDSSIDPKDEEVFDDGDSDDKKEADGTGPVIKVNASTTLMRDSKGVGKEDEDSQKSEDDSEPEKLPVWLHMNPIERDRQAKLAKQKYKKDKQTSLEQAKDAITKKTGKFLSDNLLPLLKKPEPSAEKNETDVTDTSTSAGKSKQTSKFLPGSMMSFLKKEQPSPDNDQSAENDISITVPKNERHDSDNPLTKKLSSQSMMTFFKKKPASSEKSHPTETSTLVVESKGDGTDSDTSATKKMLSSQSTRSFLKKKPSSSDKSQAKDQAALLGLAISRSKSDGTDSDTSVAKKMLNSMSFLKKKPASSDTIQSDEKIGTTIAPSKIDGTDSETSLTKNILSSMSFLKKKPHSMTAAKSDGNDKGGNPQNMMSFLRKKIPKTANSESTGIDASMKAPKIEEDGTDISVTNNGEIQKSTKVEQDIELK